jgi:UDP-N-acetylmuramoyl-tripeptide--D-alanyl-D-alanine ligase
MPRFSWTSERIAEALDIPATGLEPRVYGGVSTDTRTLRPGELFVALRGERFDGVEFVAAAAAAGAPGAVAEHRPQGVADEFELFLVDDTLRALGQLATVRRRALDPKVVAITGTSGKTTTRELTAAVLGPGAYASPANYNNLVGLPLSILAAPEGSGVWLLELASNQAGEIDQLARIAEPDFAVITSVSEGHLEGLGDLQGVMEEKLALLSNLRVSGQALVCDEPADLVQLARQRLADVRTVGLSPEADVRPQSWSVSADGVAWRWSGVDFRLAGFGAHLIRDALFALAVAQLLGVDAPQAAQRLATVKLPPMRGELRQLGDLTLLVDCYNANPASFRAALDSLSALAAGRRRAVLAGTMLELGEQSQMLHGRVARWIADEGIELIAASGEFATGFAGMASELGERLIRADDFEDAYCKLSARLRGDEVVLIKASRAKKFERAIPLFERDFGGKGRLRISGTHG